MKKNSQITVSKYINENYRDYSIYTNNERAIPSIIDGFKPVQRKIIYAATKECANDYVKLSSLGGVLAKVAAYHHGNVSAENAIIKMAQTFNQNIPLLDHEGTFGTRPVPDAGAARYIFVKLGDHFHNIFKDNDILPQSLDEDDHPEPLYYLPLIPTVLLNGSKGMAVGFAVNILPRSLEDLTDACIQYVSKGKTPDVHPSLKGFKGSFEPVTDTKYRCHGVIEHVRLNIYHITELPLSKVHENYVGTLNKLQEDGIIKRFVDDTSDVFDFTIYAASGVTQERLESELKLSEMITENISLIEDFEQNEVDQFNNIKIEQYDNVKQVIEKFCDFRVTFYATRIQHNIDKLNRSVEEKHAKVEFINDVVNKKIDITNLSRKQLQDLMVAKGYTLEVVNKIISIPVYTMTKDNMAKLNKDITDHQKDIVWWGKQEPKKLYLKDLRALLNQYK